MTAEAKFSLQDRLDLEEQFAEAAHRSQSRLLRITARHRLAEDVEKAQGKVVAAEDQAHAHLPKPPPENAEELRKVVEHNLAVMDTRQQLERLTKVYGPLRLELADQLGAAVAGDEAADEDPTPPRAGRKPRTTNGASGSS